VQEAISGYPSKESKRRLQLIVILLSVGAFLLLQVVSIAPVIPIIMRGRGSRLEFSQGFFVLCFVILMVLQLILPTILGAILTRPMRRHRLSELAPGAHLAPLWRRGLAKAVDAMIILGPSFVAQVMTLLSLPEKNGLLLPSDMPRWGMMAGIMSLVWACPWLIIYIMSEARTGRTAGKALLGIRVLNEEMQPCGIGAVVKRNLLLLIDANLFGIIGICFAALSVRWQRLGDLAARTIVVQDTAK
jgi:uncharacterized RDD family membrane protein YckC